jgi:hypothetical protein
MTHEEETPFKPVLCDLIQYYYENVNSAGGYLHIVLDDGNTDIDSIWFCIDACEKHNDVLGLLIARTLCDFSDEERQQMYKTKWGILLT